MKITDWFKGILKDNKELNLRIGAGLLATIMVASGLSGCTKENKNDEENTTSVSDTMNEENKEVTFDNLVSSTSFLANYDFDTEVTRIEKSKEVLEYLKENEPTFCYLSVISDSMRNYEMAVFGEYKKYYGQVVSAEKKVESEKYNMNVSINDKYSILMQEESYDSILNHETGEVHKLPYRNIYVINDSYIEGVIASNGERNRYKLLYANGKEALSASYNDIIYDKNGDKNMLFLVSNTYTDMVNLETKEMKRLDNFIVQDVSSSYILGAENETKEQYVFSYDNFDIKKITKIKEGISVYNLIDQRESLPTFIAQYHKGYGLGVKYISDIYGNQLSSDYNYIYKIISYGECKNNYYIGVNIYGDEDKDISEVIMNCNGKKLYITSRNDKSCYAVFNDNVFLFETDDKHIAFKIEDDFRYTACTIEGDIIQPIGSEGLLVYNQEENMTYAYDTNLELLNRTKEDIAKFPINEIFPQEKSKVKEKTMNNN